MTKIKINLIVSNFNAFFFRVITLGEIQTLKNLVNYWANSIKYFNTLTDEILKYNS